MSEVIGAVLKKRNIHLAPPAGAGRAPAPQAAASPSAGCHTPVARIVRQTPTEAMLEVVCSCGRKTLLRCQYAQNPAAPIGAAGGADAPAPANPA